MIADKTGDCSIFRSVRSEPRRSKIGAGFEIRRGLVEDGLAAHRGFPQTGDSRFRTRLTYGSAKGKYVRTAELIRVPSSIARADLADFMVEACESTLWVGRAVQLGG